MTFSRYKNDKLFSNVPFKEFLLYYMYSIFLFKSLLVGILKNFKDQLKYAIK